GGSANRNEGFYFLRAEAQLSSEYGGNAGADLHCRTFAAKRNSARQCCGSTKEFSEDSFWRDVAIAREQCSFRLGHSTSTGIRKKPEEEIPHGESACYGNQKTRPGGSLVSCINLCAKTLRQQNESNDGSADECANNEREDEKYLLLTPHRERSPIPASFSPGGIGLGLRMAFHECPVRVSELR